MGAAEPQGQRTADSRGSFQSYWLGRVEACMAELKVVLIEELGPMSQVILATVENGLLKPDREIGLSSGTKVRLTLELCDDALAETKQACDELDHLCDESPVESRGTRLTRDQLHQRR